MSPSSTSSSVPAQTPGISSALSTFLHSVQSRRWLTLRRKTQRLDECTQNQLHDYLNDHVGNRDISNRGDDDENDSDDIIPDDFEVIQKQLDIAYARQEELEEKAKFLKTRLETYQSKLGTLEHSLKKENDDSTKTNRKEKLEQLKQMLQKKTAEEDQVIAIYYTSAKTGLYVDDIFQQIGCGTLQQE